MTYTASFEELEFAGAMAIRFLEIDFSQYDGDETITTADVGLSRIQNVVFENINGTGYRATWNESNNEVQLWDGATEAATDGSVTDVTFRAMVIGRQ